jgi:diaminopimelate epimerase
MDEHTMTPSTPPHAPLRLTKHQGAGNDFLVLVDLDDRSGLDPELVRALCDRRFGVGADGVIRILAGTNGADLTMDLTNADGSTAAMSGNGMRCLAQAAVRAGLVEPPSFTVATLAGVRSVEYPLSAGSPADGDDGPTGPTPSGSGWASVDMGPARLGPELPPAFAEHRARLVDMGNPHLVLLGDDPAGIDVAELGGKLQSDFPDGVNVEFVALGPGPDAVTMRVWERGVGETLACGTGSAASAATVHDWGLVGPAVEVHNPGGTLRVILGDAGAGSHTVVLIGPVAFVAAVEVDPASLLVGRRR